jgi:hypothetical protein
VIRDFDDLQLMHSSLYVQTTVIMSFAISMTIQVIKFLCKLCAKLHDFEEHSEFSLWL